MSVIILMPGRSSKSTILITRYTYAHVHICMYAKTSTHDAVGKSIMYHRYIDEIDDPVAFQ